MNFFERISKLDRRWIYLFFIVVVVLAYIFKFSVPVTTTPEVAKIYNYIEDSLKAGDKILMALDYDPNALAELHPMAYAILEQCYRKQIRVIGVTLSQYGSAMVEGVFKTAAANYREKVPAFEAYNQEKGYPAISYKKELEYGVDYCFLGYRPYPALTILGMGQNFRLYFPQDYYNTPLDALPIMDRVRNYDDVKIAIDITAGNTADMWLEYGNGRYGVRLALGVTGVMGADYYQYLHSGQLFGLIGGWKGAAEYEKLVGAKEGEAQKGMAAQVVAHLTIILFIVLGNLGYFISRSKQKRGLASQ